jgi:hypothetical protein
MVRTLRMAANSSRLDQPHRIDDDHRRQRGVRQQAEQRRQQQHGRGGGAGGDQRGLLRTAARRAHHRRLRGAAAGRHGAQQRAAEVGHTRGDQFPVGIHRRVAAGHEGAPGGDRFGETHQRDAQRPGHQLLDQRRVRQGDRGQALRNQADGGYAGGMEAEQPRGGDAAAHRDQRRRRMRPQFFHAEQHDQRRGRNGQGERGGVGQVLYQAQHVVEEALLGNVQAEEFRHLVEHDHQADARLETGQHRRGDEVGDETQAQHGGQQQHHAHQRGQGRGGGQQLRRIAVGHREAELRAGQDRQRGGGADVEHARGAEQGVDRHRHQGGIQADGDRQAGDRGIGHGLGQHDGRCGEAGDQVEAQGIGDGWVFHGVLRMVNYAVMSALPGVSAPALPPVKSLQ